MVESPGLLVVDEYPLSPMQQGMLFHNLDRREPGVDIEQIRCTLNESVDITRLLAAWDHVVARHDILRTAFEWDGRPEPVQHVHRAVTVPATIVDWRDTSAIDQEARFAALMADDRARGFDLSSAPLMRLTVVQRDHEAFELLWTFHHAILDGRSFPILLREVFGLYDAFGSGRELRLPPPRPYRSYIDWLQARNPEASKAFWKRRLGGFSEPTPLLASVPGGVETGARHVELRLTLDETQTLRNFARSAHCTVGTLVTAAWGLLLSRYTGESEVVFGVTRACRQSTVEGADEMVGLFINSLPFRLAVPNETSVTEWLAAVRAEHVAFREHEHTPLAKIQAWSDVARGTPLFETLVVFENYLLDSVLNQIGGPWARRRFHYEGQTNFPVTLVCYADAEMLLRLEYDGAQLHGAVATQMLQHVARMVLGFVEDGGRRVVDVPMLSAEERTELLPVAQRPSGIQTFCLHERFERRAAETPDAPALTFDGHTITYEQLNRRANQLAHRLRALGVGPDVLVGVHLERSAELIVAILGILKAGGAYLPLDPAYPADRLRFIIDDAHVSVVVTARPLLAGFPGGAELVCVDEADGEPIENPQPVADADNLAYVIYTSGSTGKPKGALITHANVSRLFDASDIWFQFGRDDVWTLFHSYAFDFSVWEIWGALLYGGRLVVVPYWVSRDPEAFVDLLARERVTVLNQTPSAFRQLIDADGARPRQAALAIRYVVLGGEALELSSLRPWFERRGDERPQVINMYGITETTVHVTYRRITRADVEAGAGSVIGVPIADLDVYILDKHQRLAPVGVTGEIYVGGAGVARGYLDRPELTRARFIADPVGGTGMRLYRSGDLGRWLPSGELEYLGRIDDQVKIRGFRIELGEIEAVVRSAAGVRDAAIIARQDQGVEKRLVAYVVVNHETALDDVRRHVQAQLPEYMIPAAFVAMDALPLTSNGKIDRRALPEPAAAARTDRYVAPRDETERTLAAVWSAVLRRDGIGIDENFFELGGDSILSIQVIARSRQAGLHLTTRDLFRYPTIEALSAVVTTSTPAANVERRGIGDAPLTPISRWFFEQDLVNRHHWNQAFLFEVPASVDLVRLEAAFQSIVAHHDAFRLRFSTDERGWQSRYVPEHPPVPIVRVSLDGLDSTARAQAIAAASASAHSSLDISNGPAIAVVHVGEQGANGRLLIVAHHLAIDAVSWRVLLEDLEAAYTSTRAGAEPQLSHRTTSFKFWAERLVDYASGQAKDGLSAWTGMLAGRSGQLPVDHVADQRLNTEASARTITVSLSAEETESLLRRAPAAYATQVNDLLLAALVKAAQPWTGSDTLLVDLEGHGREDIFDDVDLSRTIGWFTTMFPVGLDAADGTPAGLIKRTKETLRHLHHRGLSYGALRYLSPDPDVRRALGESSPRQLLFNYLGQVDAFVAGSSLFAFAPESSGAWHAGENRRSHLVDVLAQVANGQLQIQWTYSPHFHDESTIGRVADDYATALRELVAHCVALPTVSRTPSDFALSNVTQQELDELVERFPTLLDVYPLSTMQQLFYSMDGVDAALGFEQWEFQLDGPLDPARLRAAWEQVVARHPILRTAFVQVGVAGPQQVVLDRVDIPWLEEDWRGYSTEEQEQRLKDFLEADRVRPFSLGQPPLMRIALLRMSDASQRLIWSTHHLLVDGWSWPLIFSELSSLYASDAARADLPDPCAYREYVAWLRQHGGADDERFWRRVLDGITEPTPIPALAAVAHENLENTSEVVRLLTPATSAAISALARTHHVTLGTIVGAAWSLVLAHHSGRSDVVFGASFAGRPDGIAGIETMVGPCVNNLPIRARIGDGERIGPWLRGLHDQIGELTAYQTTPLTEIHACSGVPSWTRLFDSLLVVQNYVVDEKVTALGDVRLQPLRCPESTNYPATIVVRPGEQLEIKVMRSSARLTRASATACADDLVLILSSLAEGGDATLDGLLARLPGDTRGLAGRAAAERRLRRGPRLAPRTEMERTLVTIWRELFDGDIGTDENYFELGVHSLMLVRAHERMCATIRPDLPIVALFQYPTVRDLAAHLTASAAPGRRDADIRARAQQQQEAFARRKALAKANRPQ